MGHGNVMFGGVGGHTFRRDARDPECLVGGN